MKIYFCLVWKYIFIGSETNNLAGDETDNLVGGEAVVASRGNALQGADVKAG